MGKEEETHQTMTQTTDEKSNEVVSTCSALSKDDVSLTDRRLRSERSKLTMLRQSSVMSTRGRKLWFGFLIRAIDLEVLVPCFGNN